MLAIAICLAIAATGIVCGGAIIAHIGPFQDGAAVARVAATRAVRYAIVFAPFCILPLALAFFWERRISVNARAGVVRDVLPAVLAGTAIPVLPLLAGLAEGWAHFASAPRWPAALVLAGVGTGAVFTLFQVAAEELLFRYWLQPQLMTRWGTWPGIAATAVVFAFAHLLAQPLSPVALLDLFLAGALFGIILVRTGTLAAPIAAHWAWNWVERSVAGAVPNPGVDPLGSLLNLDLGGTSLFGIVVHDLNGTVEEVITLLLLIVCWLSVRARRPQRLPRAG